MRKHIFARSKIFLIEIFLIGLLISCNGKEETEAIEILYLPEGTTTDIPLNCNQIDSNTVPVLNKRIITSKEFNQKIRNRVLNLENSKDSSMVNVRIKSLIRNINGTTDTLCLGEYFGIIYNGEIKIDDPKLLNIMKNEIYD